MKYTQNEGIINNGKVNVGGISGGSNVRDIMPMNNRICKKTITIYKELLNNEADKELSLAGSQRPYLKFKFNNKDVVQCYGYCIRAYNESKSMYTLLNVHDLKGNYIADHIQINLSRFEENPVGAILYISGEVEEYDHRINACKEYSIKVDRCEMYEGYFNRILNTNYKDIDDIDNVSTLMKSLGSNGLIKLQQLLFETMNNNVPNMWLNVIQNYIMDLYFFGEYRSYMNSVPVNQISDIMRIDIILIYAATIYYLNEFPIYTPHNIYHVVTRLVNTQQSIKHYKKINSPGNSFDEFIIDRFCQYIEDDNKINSFIERSWEKVKMRKKNFGAEDICFDDEQMIVEAYKVLIHTLPKLRK